MRTRVRNVATVLAILVGLSPWALRLRGIDPGWSYRFWPLR